MTICMNTSGFHQASGSCLGHVPVADSQYLHKSLGQRILGAFYLGIE